MDSPRGGGGLVPWFHALEAPHTDEKQKVELAKPGTYCIRFSDKRLSMVFPRTIRPFFLSHSLYLFKYTYHIFLSLSLSLARARLSLSLSLSVSVSLARALLSVSLSHTHTQTDVNPVGTDPGIRISYCKRAHNAYISHTKCGVPHLGPGESMRAS